MKSMTENLFGKLLGDKGYVSKALSDLLFGNGIQLIAKPKKNMKKIRVFLPMTESSYEKEPFNPYKL